MYTTTNTHSFFFTTLFFFTLLFSNHVASFEFLAHGNHEQNLHDHEAFRRKVEDILPLEEQRELYKRQLAGILGAAGGAAGGGGIPGLDALTGLLSGSALGGGGGGGFGPVDVSGAHQFEPPGASDMRGPCPGLNAAANHHYLSHDGVVGMFEVVSVINQIYGVGLDLAIANALLAVLGGGDPVTLKFSIGGPSPKVGPPLGGLLGLFGEPQGIALAHNIVEADCSLTRDDLFDTGDSWTLDINLFKRFYYSVPEGGQFDFHTMASIAARRWHECVATSPNFYWGPVAGMVVSNAAKIFAARIMANYSSPYHPEGVLTHDILKSFFGVYDSPAPFTYVPGWERIPYNWYHRPGAYGLLEFNVDLIEWIGWYPELASIGGNLGAPNTFAGIDLSSPESGIMNLPNLLQGNNLFCFALELLKTATPSFTNNLFKTLFDLVGTTLTSLGCPEIGLLTRGGVSLNENMQSIYPGAARAKMGL